MLHSLQFVWRDALYFNPTWSLSKWYGIGHINVMLKKLFEYDFPWITLLRRNGNTCIMWWGPSLWRYVKTLNVVCRSLFSCMFLWLIDVEHFLEDKWFQRNCWPNQNITCWLNVFFLFPGNRKNASIENELRIYF